MNNRKNFFLLIALTGLIVSVNPANANAQQAAQARQQQAQARRQQAQARQQQSQAEHRQQQQQRQQQMQAQRQQHQQQMQAQRQEQKQQRQQQMQAQRQEQKQQHQQQAQAQHQEQHQHEQQMQAQRQEQMQQRQQQGQREQAANNFRENHPARSEVLSRDNSLNRQLNQDKGDLNGNYNQLESRDNGIRKQEQTDAARNGGRLTGQEYGQLNREENGLQKQIGRDNYGAGDAQFQANHPGRSEVLGRDNGLNNLLKQDKGDLNGNYNRLESRDSSIRRQEQIDAARNGGRLTGQEYGQLNREENGLQKQIGRDNYGAGDAQFQANHPGRSEVLGRDNNLNNLLKQDKGDLNGNYNQLESRDNSIRRQEQADAARNGGRLTGQEYGQLNREENGLKNQIVRDNYGAGDAQFQANHPGRSEVLGRDNSLNNLLNQDKGDLNGNYNRLESRDNSIRRQEQIDAARDGGHLTGREYSQLNREENGLSKQIGRDNYGAGDAQFQANHPRRSEVLGRDNSLNSELNRDKGDLSGQFGNLKRDDNSIRRQEQRDAAKNGGFITSQQQTQLNREETNLQKLINKDN